MIIMIFAIIWNSLVYHWEGNQTQQSGRCQLEEIAL